MNYTPQKVVQELQSADFLEVLRSFLEVLKTCIGPKGGIKVFVTSGGISVVTSSSSRVLNNYIFTHPVCILMSQIIKSQNSVFGDYGLYTGVLAMSLLEKSLKQTLLKPSQVSELIQGLYSKVSSLLDHESIKLKLDFNTVKQLTLIARTILASKPACGFNKKDIDTFAVQIVKTFIHTITEDFGDVIILKATHIDDFQIVNGVLYQIDMEQKFVEDYVTALSCNSPQCIPLLLFDIMLTDSKPKKKEESEIACEEYFDVLKDAILILENAIKIGVKIVCCQKVVHKSLRLVLERNRVLLLDRLGTELCNAVKKLSGAKSISTLKGIPLNTLKKCLGTVDSVKYTTFGSRSFVSLEKNNVNVVTLLLRVPNEEAFAEIKIVVQQVLNALRQVTCQQFVLPGAGCLEMWLASQLQMKVVIITGNICARFPCCELHDTFCTMNYLHNCIEHS